MRWRLGNVAPPRNKRVVESLPVFLSLKGRPVILLGEGAAAAAKARLLDRAGARIIRDEMADAAIAIVAIEDDAAATAAAGRLKARGILVNAMDRPALCDFTLPAIVDRSPVIIAIGTGGASASLAKALRQWLEAMLPASLGGLAEALKTARAKVKARFADAGERRAFLDGLLMRGGPLDPLASHADPDATIKTALGGGVEAGGLEHVALTSTDPDELTSRAARLLAGADRVYHLPDVPPAILDRARADAERIAASAPPSDVPPGRSVFIGWSRA